jgi:hypothetical protein
LGRGGICVSTTIEISEFFFVEMTCQNVIGGQKTLIFCLGMIEWALYTKMIITTESNYRYYMLNI